MLIPDEIYTIYFDYQTDYRGDYTCCIGYSVSESADVPEGLVKRQIEGGKYAVISATGKMPEALMATWGSIWQSDEKLQRLYHTDFQRHVATDHVDIYLGLKISN